MGGPPPLSEFDLIQRYFVRNRPHSATTLLAIGDDAALTRITPEQELVVTVDTLIAGHHFPLDTSSEDIGYKALAVNLSDLAAMGATPRWFTLALALPEADPRFLEGFANGLFQLADHAAVELIGGDTVRGALTITIQALGSVPSGEALRRSGAGVGDAIFVSGTVGDGAAGLKAKREGLDAPELIARLNRPTPRVALGQQLRQIATAAIDISDGLCADLGHLLSASGVGAEIALLEIPASPQLRHHFPSASEQQRLMLSGGDDYELLFTVPKSRCGQLEQIATNCHTPIHRIGTITNDSGLTLIAADGGSTTFDPGKLGGFDHFRQEVL
ncbi:MAG: thiamine-phosphate kinase [Gammaproteobacteria bacterium]|nr:thiamine-phosphate kinase [Gammaproteobacteria bacterium]